MKIMTIIMILFVLCCNIQLSKAENFSSYSNEDSDIGNMNTAISDRKSTLEEEEIKTLEEQIIILQKENRKLEEQIKETELFKIGGYGMYMGIIVLITSFLVILISAYLLEKEIKADQIISSLGLVLILSYSIFILIAGYNEKQIAPVYGLMGTALGYIFGNTRSKGGDGT